MPRPLALALLALACAIPARATDYWVKNGGADGADGLSVATAWATLQHAADAVGPGDTVHVLDGSYQGFDLRTAGTPGSPITFRAEGPAASITADNPVTPDGINVENAGYVVLDGFVVSGRTRAGIRAAVSPFVTVRNCRTGNNGRWGIFTGFTDDLLIEDNETWGSVLEHGIYASNSGDRPVIRQNHVHDNHGNGIHMNGDESQGGDGTISDALVEANVVHGNGAGGGSGINMDGVVDSVVRNNLLYDNHASGVSLYRIDGATGATGNLVVNNTIVNAADGRWCINIANGSTANTVVNNILYNLHPSRGVITIDAASRPGFVSDRNSLMDRFSTNGGLPVIGFAAWQALGYDANSFLATPADHFLVPGSDFRLLDASPAIDVGTPTGAPPADLEGNPRPVGAGVDLGAYERQNLTCGDGTPDAGEQCGEPGLSCADPCTTCLQCVCVAPPPVCGDGTVCGTEACEVDGHCGPGQTCEGCACVNAAVCASGIGLERATLKLRAQPFSVQLRAEAVLPLPWLGVDPLANGLRLVVDATVGAGGFDATLPGGAVVERVGWKVNGTATRWTYTDPAGAHAGLTRVVLQSKVAQPGRLKLTARGKGGSLTLPDVAAVRAQVVFGTATECAALLWHPPGGDRPRCDGDEAKLRCR